jgi:hypothetical protein
VGVVTEELGITTMEKASPVLEKVQSSTPVIFAPRAMGKEDTMWCTLKS